jgi:hypothetical protein
MSNGYNPVIVSAYFRQQGIPVPVFEYHFHPARKWRLDIAWPDHRVCLEVQGGIWSAGRHNRGAAMLAEWEKCNTLAGMGWRVLYCQPTDLLVANTIAAVRIALAYRIDRT